VSDQCGYSTHLALTFERGPKVVSSLLPVVNERGGVPLPSEAAGRLLLLLVVLVVIQAFSSLSFANSMSARLHSRKKLKFSRTLGTRILFFSSISS